MASSFLAVAATFTLAAQPYSSTGLPNFPKSWSVRESQHAKVEGSLVVWDGMVYNDQQNISRPHCKYCWLLQQRGTVCARSQLHPAQQIRSGLRNRQRRLILYFVCICCFFDLSWISWIEGTPPTSSHQRNCSVTAYVDDRKERTSYHFYEPNRADRGYVYFVQPGAK